MEIVNKKLAELRKDNAVGKENAVPRSNQQNIHKNTTPKKVSASVLKDHNY